MKNEFRKLSIIIPAYNEAKTELYLAAEVRDESIYVWDFSRDPYQDGCDFFIGLDHGDSGRFTLQLAILTSGGSS